MPSRRCCNSQMTSRPLRWLRISPACSITRKCFVIPCRVTFAPEASSVIDCGPSTQSLLTNLILVSSPSAAKMSAGPDGLDRISLFQILLDQFGLLLPSALVGFEGLGAAMQWNFVETGFGNRQENAGVFLLQFKSDERH